MNLSLYVYNTILFVFRSNTSIEKALSDGVIKETPVLRFKRRAAAIFYATPGWKYLPHFACHILSYDMKFWNWHVRIFLQSII